MSDASPRTSPPSGPPADASPDQPDAVPNVDAGSSLAEIRAARPWEATTPRLLAIILMVAVWPPVTVYASSLGPSPIYLAVFGAEVLFLFATFEVARGRKGGRILGIVTLAVIWIVLVPYVWIGFADPIEGRFAAGADVVGLVGSLTALVLMFRPRTTAYIAAVSAATPARTRRARGPRPS